jgi:hypothetical protein
MSESTRARGAPGCGGGGAGRGPAPPTAGASPGGRLDELLDALLRDRRDGSIGRTAVRMRHDLRVPRGVLLACAAPPGEAAAAGRAIAGRLPRAVLVDVTDDAPPHAAVVVPVASPPAWRHALSVAETEALGRDCLVLARPPVTGLRALRAAYFRAVADAGLARAARVAGPVVRPGELVIPRMLSLLDVADQQALLAPLQPILALPPPHRSMYLRTLDALRRSGTHSGAAAHLHLHVNSVRYRVDRIEEMTRLRLDDPADRLALDLAVMLALLRASPAPERGELWVADSDHDFGLEVMDERERAPRQSRWRDGSPGGALASGPSETTALREPRLITWGNIAGPISGAFTSSASSRGSKEMPSRWRRRASARHAGEQ